MSMAAKLSDLADKMPRVHLQADSQAEVPIQGVKDLQEPEEEDSSPSHSLSWSPAWRAVLFLWKTFNGGGSKGR